jgi:hypothetical protein
VLDDASCACRSSADDERPEPSGAGSGSVSQPRAVSAQRGVLELRLGRRERAASLPSTCVCACSVSQVSRHSG